MKTFLWVLVTALSFSVSGCGKEEMDMQEYVVLIEELNQEQNDIVHFYETAFINEPDIEKAYVVLHENILPRYKQFSEKAKNTAISDPELLVIFQLYVQAAEEQYALLKMYKEPEGSGQETLLEEGEQRTRTMNQRLQQHRQQLDALAKERRVVIEHKK